MISLCLQCCPGDMHIAIPLAQLIADIEPIRREETEFFLIYRRDCPPAIERAFFEIAGPKFGRALAAPGRNFDTGHPAGSNMLAASAFLEMNVLRRLGTFTNPAFLLFEPDNAPLTLDWIDQLSAEWDKVAAQGKEAFGHWNQVAGPETLHLNGNAVFRCDWYERHQNLLVGGGMMGWDFFYREQIVQLSCDSDLIYQHYARPCITPEELSDIMKNGHRPALFHGIKCPEYPQIARTFLGLDALPAETAP